MTNCSIRRSLPKRRHHPHAGRQPTATPSCTTAATRNSRSRNESARASRVSSSASSARVITQAIIGQTSRMPTNRRKARVRLSLISLPELERNGRLEAHCTRGRETVRRGFFLPSAFHGDGVVSALRLRGCPGGPLPACRACGSSQSATRLQGGYRRFSLIWDGERRRISCLRARNPGAAFVVRCVRVSRSPAGRLSSAAAG